MADLAKIRKAGTPLEPGEHWTYTCGKPDCNVWVQGGRPALDAHYRVVHGE